MESITSFVIKQKWLVIGIVTAISIALGYQLKYLQVDSNIVNALPDDDPVVSQFREIGGQFGSNQIGLIVVEADNVFERQNLESIDRITDSLMAMDGVISVTSLTNMTNFQVDEDNFEVDNLIRRSSWPETAEEAEELKEEVTQNEMVVGQLVAKDGSSSIVLFYFDHEADIKTIASNIVEKLNGMELPVKLYFAGATFLTSYVADIISTDMARLIPISFVLIALILFLSFRSWRGVFLPLLTAGLAILWAIGTFVLMGFKLSMVSNNVPIIVLAVGSAYSIHVFNRIQQSNAGHRSDMIKEAMKVIAMPVFLAGVTTAIGFISFIFGAYLSMIRDFGILAALGTLYAAILALFLVPALLAVLPGRKRKRPRNEDPFMKRFLLVPLYKMNTTHPKRVVGVWVILVVIGIGGMSMVQRSVSVADYFRAKHPASLADKVMEANYGGSKPVFAVFKGDVQSPELLKGMKEFGDYMLESPYVTSTQSIADVVVKLNDALSEDKGIPDEKLAIQQLWFILGQQDLSQLVTEDLDQAVLMAKFNNEGQTNMKKWNKYVNAYLDSHQTEDYTIQITGMPYVNVRLDRSLIKSQTTSLLLAVFLVVMLVSFIFKSVREGLYASVPIIGTIIILYGVMGLTGIPLNVVTVLVASVAMGIGIDYSIHFISSFNLSFRAKRDLPLAIEEATMISGKAIFVNFISVSAGFLVLVFSDLMPMVYFGILIALSMLGSAMGALTLLPAILVLGKRRLVEEGI